MEKENLLRGLSSVPKAPVKVQFMGHDAETKQYAAQLTLMPFGNS